MHQEFTRLPAVYSKCCGMATSRENSCNGTFAIHANCLIPEDFIKSEHTDSESQSACSTKVQVKDIKT
ncbi:hypothetical protein ZWY2020_046774 [Hordeum vulgare]|nr:hypothetical protein ZWY2020_046774 [Hordeum vulgare]